jgi:hypothetical protein
LSRDLLIGMTIPPNINVLAQILLGIPEYQNFYFGQVSKATNLLGGPGGWADSDISLECNVINAAASDDSYKQYFANGQLCSCGTADFQSGVQDGFLAARSEFALAEVQSNGFRPVASDPQISTVAMTAPNASQIPMMASCRRWERPRPAPW